LTQEEIERHKTDIDKMNIIRMATLWRFTPAGEHIYFTTPELATHFQERMKSLGGITPDISKAIGW
jgi:hypothetical protein